MTDSPKTLIAIPAREQSSRLPQKLLADVAGKPLIARTLANAAKCEWADKSLITDSDAIANVGESIGFPTILDKRPSGNGTVRVARAIERLMMNRVAPKYSTVVNYQADQVVLSPDDVFGAVRHHVSRNPDGVTSLVAHLTPADVNNPNVVKACCNRERAFWFSRGKHKKEGGWYKHVGIYVFSVDVLRRLGGVFVHPVALEANLEQLTWLLHGLTIAVVRAEKPTFSVNDAQDLEDYRAMVKRESEREAVKSE